jgi:dihydroxy-acid dehydratase
MYTANTLASAIETIGMALPGSSSFPAESQEKRDECASIGNVMRNLIEKNILPHDIMTRSAFENAMVSLGSFFVTCITNYNSSRYSP